MKKLAGWAFAIAFALTFLPGRADADIIGADFHESLDSPDFRADGPKLLENLAVPLPSAGPQLTEDNVIDNPSGFSNSLEVSFDSTTNILSLTASDLDIYQTITVTIDNLLFDDGQEVLGITPLVTGSAVTEGFGTLTTTTSFSPNSFSVTYSIVPGNFDFFQINGDGAVDQFQITLGLRPVPEPSSLAMLLAGTILLSGAAWRRSRSARPLPSRPDA